MLLTIFLEKTVATTAEGAQLTAIVKEKLKTSPEIKVTAQCIEVIELPPLP